VEPQVGPLLCGKLKAECSGKAVNISINRTEMEAVLDLDFQDALAPSVGDGLLDVEVTDGGIFDHLEKPDDMTPGQLLNRLFRNCPVGECIGK